MAVQTTVVGAWVEGAVRNWFEEEEGGDGRRYGKSPQEKAAFMVQMGYFWTISSREHFFLSE